MAYLEGQAIRFSASFTDIGGSAVDPGTVTFAYKDPAGAVTDLVYGTDAAVVRDSAGHYHVDLTALTNAGEYWYRWHSTGNGQAAEERTFEIVESEVV